MRRRMKGKELRREAPATAEDLNLSDVSLKLGR